MKLPLHRPIRRSAIAAFTLIEIILVLVIIAILLGGTIAIINRQGFITTAQTTRITGDISTIDSALLTYFSNAGRYPSTDQGLQALVTKPTTGKVPGRWVSSLDEIPTDPYGNDYQYRYPGARSGKAYDLFSFGADEQESADDVGNGKIQPASGGEEG